MPERRTTINGGKSGNGPGPSQCSRRSCAVCGSLKRQQVYKQRFASLSGQKQLSGYDVAVCSECGFAFADRIPSQAWFDSYYDDVSKYTYDQRNGVESSFDTSRFKDITRRITGRFPKNSHILDFGCATGGLLFQLKQEGYSSILGMDRSAAAADIAKRLYGVPVINDSLSNIKNRSNSLDLAILVGVLEHLCDINELMSGLGALVKDQGYLYIETPDVEGFAACMDMPFQQFSVEHINFFSNLSLTRLMAGHGFAPIEVTGLVRDFTKNSKMPTISGLFRRAPGIQEIPAVASTRNALLEYVALSKDTESRLSRSIDRLVASKKPVIVWGVGTYTLHLLEQTKFGDLNIIAFVDSNSHYQSQTLRGRRVLAPWELKGFAQAILISSLAYQSEIEEQIRQELHLANEIITLEEAAHG
jgi:SAM-dependent methyltransferase